MIKKEHFDEVEYKEIKVEEVKAKVEEVKA
jgi:hypothetical protein